MDTRDKIIEKQDESSKPIHVKPAMYALFFCMAV
jgi:hypothetical protein